MDVSRVIFSNTAMFYGEFNDRRQQFSDACKWLSEEMGFPYQSTRMGDYERLLKTFVNPKAEIPTDKDVLDEFYLFMQAATEACQIIRLWNTFKSGEYQGLKDRIKHVMSGKSLRAEAIKKNAKGQNNDPARDFAFELNIASRFLKGGYNVNLTDDCDVVVEIGKSKLYVECKRVKSVAKLRSRIVEANKQISIRIGANRSDKYGLIALDVTDIILPEGTVTAVNDIRLFDMQIQRVITQFAAEHRDITDQNTSRDVAGVLFEYNSSAFIYGNEKVPTLGFSRSACLSRKASQSKKSLDIVNGFIGKIGNQNL